MISVCMATYNGKNTIFNQLNSILQQLSSEDEIVIVDDMSSDNTLEIIESISNKSKINFKIIKNNRNLGPIKSFEKSMENSSGEYIFFSDQDDMWLPTKVHEVMNEFKTGAKLVVHDSEVVDGHFNVIDNSWNHYNKNNLNQGIFGNIVSNSYTGAMMAISRDLLDAAIPFPNNIPMHDQWIFDVAKMKKFKISIINKPLMKYVRHGNNVTGMSKRKFIPMFTDRFKLIVELIKYIIKLK
ncbi:glycosyltransferase [Companilactobacillus sp. DQM5]|uniref:glycosyltransferase n=1 Tax=Companilactobacillus sp. DQM5 TaxID=3463359 RepID=UPI004059786D